MARRPRETFLLGLVVFVSAAMCLSQLAQRRGVERRARTVLVDALSGAFVLDRGTDEEVDVLSSQPSSLTPLVSAAPQARLRAVGFEASPRLRFGAMIGRGSKSIGVIVHGVPKEHLRRIATTVGVGAPARALSSAGPHAVLVSADIAKAIGVAGGDTVAVLATNRSGYVSDGLAVVASAFATGGASVFLTGVVFMSHADGAELLGLNRGETLELVARPLQDSWSDAETTARIAAAAGDLRFTSWDDAVPMLEAVQSVWRAGGVITQAVLSSIAFLLVLNAMLAKLYDRTAEIVSRATGHISRHRDPGFTLRWCRGRRLARSSFHRRIA